MMTEKSIEIGNRLYDRRSQMGLTQRKLSELLGISTTHYIAIERGARMPTTEKILKFHEVMGLDPTYLLLGNDEQLNKKNEKYNRCAASRMPDRVQQFIKTQKLLAVLAGFDISGCIRLCEKKSRKEWVCGFDRD